MNIQLEQRVKVIYGEGSLSQIGNLMKTMGCKKPFIVCDKGIIEVGILDKVTSSLESADIDFVIFDEVQPDPPVEMVEKGARICKEMACDATIAIGGGSAMDSGKGINMLKFNEKSLMTFTDFSTPMNYSPGLVCIPTTSGTGSELSDGMVISSTDGSKCPILAPNAMAEYAIVDPSLMTGMPAHLTMMTGLDTFAHVVESYTSNATNDVVAFFVEKAIEDVIKWLPIAVKDGQNIEARSHMAVASCVGGWMLGYGHTNAGHSFGHIIGANFHVPHGAACAMALPYVLKFNALAMPKNVQFIGEKLGATFTGNETPEEIGRITCEAALNFIYKTIGLQKPKEFNYDKNTLETVAEAIEKEMFQIFQPRKMSKNDALDILNKIYD
jgi:alcohol dehydrogenase